MLVCLRAWGMTYVSKSAVTIVAIALLCAGAALAGPAHVRTAGPLQAQPVATAPATGAVKAGAMVDVVARKGFWAQVRGSGATGWLKLSRLSLDSGGGAGEIAALASGRTGTGNVVSASGGRGLDAAGLTSATPDNAAVAALSGVTESAATQFAAAGKLKARSVAYLRAK